MAGVKGMRWGVRKDRSSGTKKLIDNTPSKEAASTTGETRQVVGAASGETSSDRYSRLVAQTKSDPSSLSDQDLKFVNARTEALSKIAKMNEVKPGFLEESIRKVAKQTFQNALQTAATAGTNKLIESFKPKGTGPDLKDAAAKIADAAAKTKATAPPSLIKTAATASAATTNNIMKSTGGFTTKQRVAALGKGPEIKAPVVQNDLFLSILDGLKS